MKFRAAASSLQLGSTPSRLLTCRSGSVVPMFGVGLTAILVFVGASIDYHQAHRTQTILQQAADAAVLGAMKARGLTDAERRDRAASLFTANVQGSPLTAGVTPTVDYANGTASVTADVSFPTSVLKVVGIGHLPVRARATGIAVGKKIEMAIMTDITGSMNETRNGQSKIAGLKIAAEDLLNIVMPGNGGSDDYRIAIAPFSSYVNAGQYAATVTGLPLTTNSGGSGTRYLKTCVTERTGLKAGTDFKPVGAHMIGPMDPNNTDNNYDNNGSCEVSGTTLPVVMPLSSDKAALLSHVQSFNAQGSTAGHLGTAWAWYLISPEWNQVWNLSTPAAAYSDQEVMKVVVLMTDGEYNTQYSATDSRTQALALCEGMKAQGVKVFTVGFGFDPNDPNDDPARNLLTSCASGTGHYFFPYDGDALRQVFSQIGEEVSAIGSKVRLAQ